MTYRAVQRGTEWDSVVQSGTEWCKYSVVQSITGWDRLVQVQSMKESLQTLT